jgi:hypothetical protein
VKLTTPNTSAAEAVSAGSSRTSVPAIGICIAAGQPGQDAGSFKKCSLYIDVREIVWSCEKTRRLGQTPVPTRPAAPGAITWPYGLIVWTDGANGKDEMMD